jgi:hypothetical protein
MVEWKEISSQKKLDQDFIREFKDRVNWEEISFHQTLDESFIREFKNRVSWGHIFWSQNLSSLFFEEFEDKIPWTGYILVIRSNKLRHDAHVDHLFLRNYEKLDNNLREVFDQRIKSCEKIQSWWKELAYMPITGCMYKAAMRHFERFSSCDPPPSPPFSVQ